MIPPDVATRIQPTADLAVRPALPAQEITDKLSGLVAGQRLLAEVQALMPNGSYRALINQRSVTLALPFAAKSGDVIEMEVAESDGRLTLAVMARNAADGSRTSSESTPTHLSRTGQLIGTLLGSARDGRAGAPLALPLNGNQPLAARAVNTGSELLPLLRQAIVQSGMFYEAHQAEWVEGRFSKAQLLQEPQGRLPPAQAAAAPPRPAGDGAAPANANPAPAAAAASTRATHLVAAAEAGATTRAAGEPAAPPGAATGQASPATHAVAPQVQAIVQQQLEAFATQSFSWQGQLWPGQPVHWEIEKGNDGHESGRKEPGEDDGEKWQTRLRLTLPRLGDVDAQLQVQGERIMLTVLAASAETRALLRDGSAALREQLDNAGLDLAALGIAAPPGSRETNVHSAE